MMVQFLAHLWGDYILQSDWMAQNKTKRDWPAWCHAFVYSMCFWPLCSGHGHLVLWKVFSPALAVIFSSHFLIDRYRLARYVVWAKNCMGPKKFWYRLAAGDNPRWTDSVENLDMRQVVVDDYYVFYGQTPPLWACPTGYPPNSPAWLSTWLLIIADNTLHLTINYLALRYL